MDKVPAEVGVAKTVGAGAVGKTVVEVVAGGRFGNPQQRMQQMMQRFQQTLGMSDDEFAAIQPKVQKIIQLQRDAGGGLNIRMLMGNRGGGAGGGGAGGGGGGGGAARRAGGGGGGGGGFGGFGGPPSETQTALDDLQTTLDNQSATADEIKSKLDTVRQDRAKAKQDLTAAQADLQSLLTQRQEALMVMAGLLN